MSPDAYFSLAMKVLATINGSAFSSPDSAEQSVHEDGARYVMKGDAKSLP